MTIQTELVPISPCRVLMRDGQPVNEVITHCLRPVEYRRTDIRVASPAPRDIRPDRTERIKGRTRTAAKRPTPKPTPPPEPPVALPSTQEATPPPEPLQGVAALTPRLRRIAELVAKGLKDREVAREMGYTTGTVKVRVSRDIYPAFGVHTRAQLTRVWIEQVEQGGSVAAQ